MDGFWWLLQILLQVTEFCSTSRQDLKLKVDASEWNEEFEVQFTVCSSMDKYIEMLKSSYSQRSKDRNITAGSEMKLNQTFCWEWCWRQLMLWKLMSYWSKLFCFSLHCLPARCLEQMTSHFLFASFMHFATFLAFLYLLYFFHYIWPYKRPFCSISFVSQATYLWNCEKL